jgi:cytidylate kinase
LVVTIDGPAASGKSTVARLLAAKLNATFLDTGAMYRAATLAAMRKSVDLTKQEQLIGVLDNTEFSFTPARDGMRVHIAGVDVTDEIRDPKVTDNARYIAASAPARKRLVEMQRRFAETHDKIVTEGRDQGTVVFADAAVKLFLTADPIERAKRRYRELAEAGNTISLEQVLDDQQKRDASDASRAVGPLKPALDAIIVDTTGLDAKQTADELERIVRKRIGG